MPQADLAAKREKVLEAHRLLCEVYECPIPYFHRLDPLSELVSSMLSHRTKNRDSGRAYKQLVAKYPTWQEVIDAPTESVAEAISPATWPEQKAPRIQHALQQVKERIGELSLEFLKDMEPEEARKWLQAIPGVGPKTSAAVLVFSRLRIPALPVDSHHHRVAQRLGLIGEKVGPGKAHDLLREQLPHDWNAQQLYDNHEVLMLHGQKCCYYRSPACDRCAVLHLCPYGQARMMTPRAVEGERLG